MTGRWKWIALGVLLIAVGVAGYVVLPVVHAAGAAAEYVAARACLCVFESGRDLRVCRVEMPDLVAGVEVELLEDQRAIRADIPPVASRTARYRGDGRCSVE